MTVPAMDLKELIRHTKGGRSYATLEAESGGSPGRQRWQQIATMQQNNFPDPATIKTMARVLGVSEMTVVLAAARSVGLDTAGLDGPLALLLPPTTSQLTERQVAAVVNVVRAMLEPEPAKAPLPDIHEVPTSTPGLRIVAAAYDMNPEIAKQLEVIALAALEQERANDQRRAAR